MEIFKTKLFNKWAKKERLSDAELLFAVDEILHGLVDADLGSELYKKRIASSTKGKRGGYRTIFAYRAGAAVFFCMGFPKVSIVLSHQKRLLH